MRRSMKEVRLQKSQLLQKLKENRTKHKEVYDDALVGYRKQVIECLSRLMEDAKQGKPIARYIDVEEPVNHTQEYDCIIQMLEMSLDNEIILDQNEFQCFVLDRWPWKREFLTTNSKYSLKAAAIRI